jgi:hypothetical protein
MATLEELARDARKGFAYFTASRGLPETLDYNLSRGACARNIPEAPARDRFNFKRGNLFA